MGLPTPVRAVQCGHRGDGDLTAVGSGPLHRLLVVGDDEADGDPIAQWWGQEKYLLVEADDAALRDQKPARRDRLDRGPPTAKVENLDRSPAVTPDADRTDRLDVQGAKLEVGQCLDLLRVLGSIDTEGGLEEARRENGHYRVPVAGVPA